MPEISDQTWLSLDEAARRVGVSRIRMREAIAAGLCRARKDNRGLWQVQLGAFPTGLTTRAEQANISPAQRMELLFDEIEEVNLLLADRDAQVDRMTMIIGRQQEIIARALAISEAGEAAVDVNRLSAVNDRSARLMETALAKLAARDDEIFKLRGMLERAFQTLAKFETRAELHAQDAERQRGLLERLFALANSRIERLWRRSRKPGD